MTPRVLIGAGDTNEARKAGERVALNAQQGHYLMRVLRLKPGDCIEAFDGLGNRWQARLAGSQDAPSLELAERSSSITESPLSIHLGQCLSTAERMDWTVEKAVELGATSITPLTSARSQIKLDANRAARKLDHWRSIAQSACMQSGRDVLPTVAPIQALEQWVRGAPDACRLVLDPRASSSLSQVAARNNARITSIYLLAGPESGLSEGELDIALQEGFQSVRLGPRILRTETAGLAAIAALQALAGDY